MRHFVWVVLLLLAPGTAVPAQRPKAKRRVPVVATLDVNPTRAAPGQRIALRLTVANRTDRDVVLRFRSGQRYDFVVAARGREVWRWSHGRVFTQALTQLVLKPGEPQSFDATWDQKGNEGEQVPAGAYSVTSIVTTRPKLPSSAVALRIEPARD